MKNRPIEITEELIRFKDDQFQIMNRWEDEVMKKKAEWVCQDGGNILEVGFGMGISAEYIQKQKINSHTICEIHPVIIDKLKEWSSDKKNVIVLEGDWYDNVEKMQKYDGILFDTHDDLHYPNFFNEIIEKVANINCKITWWNNLYQENTKFFETHKKAEWEVIDVNPPENTYFNNKKYYMPKYTHK